MNYETEKTGARERSSPADTRTATSALSIGDAGI